MSEVKVDTISERTTDAGVTVEGVKIEDGIATFQTAAGSPLVFEGATANLFETTFAITDPTADRTITFPDADVTLGAAGANTPSFGAYRLADFTYTSADTWTKIPMDNQEWDTDGAFDPATYKFIVPSDKAGKYFFSMTTTMTGSAGGESMGAIRLAIYKGADGETSAAFKQSWFDGAGGRQQWRCMTLTCVIELIALDFIEFYGWGENDAGSPISIGGQSMTFCSGFKLL